MFAFAGIMGVLALIYILWQHQELKKFQVTHYKMRSRKIKKSIQIAVISDLHSFSYGKNNERLIRAVFEEKPDLILIPGDLIVTGVTSRYEISLHFIQQLCASSIPVIFSNGNHESRAELPDFEEPAVYQQYRRRLKQAGVIILNNQGRCLTANGEQVCICGLELPLYSYKKGKKPYLEDGYITQQLGSASQNQLQILLAHHPAFAGQYAAWGADLTVCGHNHGGLVCIPGIGSVLSPQFLPFPKYDAGEFTIDGRKVYISRGLGTHTFHVRVFNRAELVVIGVEPGG